MLKSLFFLHGDDFRRVARGLHCQVLVNNKSISADDVFLGSILFDELSSAVGSRRRQGTLELNVMLAVLFNFAVWLTIVISLFSSL